MLRLALIRSYGRTNSNQISLTKSDGHQAGLSKDKFTLAPVLRDAQIGGSVARRTVESSRRRALPSANDCDTYKFFWSVFLRSSSVWATARSFRYFTS